MSPIMIAASKRNENVVTYLVSVGANIKQVDRNDHNIIHIIAKYDSHKILEVNL